VRLVGTGAVALWVTVLAALSFMIHHRSFLAEDFGIYSQAWTRIGQGHLNPYSTVYGYPFVKGDLEVIMWPLALLHLITSNSVVLLWVQDLAIAACGLVTFLWVLEYLERRGVSWQKSAGIGAAVLVVFMIDPNVYGTVGFDFHIEPCPLCSSYSLAVTCGADGTAVPGSGSPECSCAVPSPRSPWLASACRPSSPDRRPDEPACL